VNAAELHRLERVVDTAGVCERIEALMPTGVRRRQLSVRTLLLGMLLVASAHRPMFLRHAHRALSGLPDPDQRRLGVLARRKSGWHRLTYRQLEYTFALISRTLAKETPDGAPSELLQEVIDSLLEASIQVCGQPASSSYALDWTDQGAWARPPTRTRASADREAAWGHRTANHPAHNETFFGYYLQLLTTVKDERGPEVPALVRRMHIASCRHDPPAQIVPVIAPMTALGIKIEDLLIDSGYSYRQPETFALPIRALGIKPIMDLHPNDRGPKGTHTGAILANGNLYCPATPTALLELSAPPAGAGAEQTAAHDQRCSELARYKLSRLTAPDQDGYHRAICPAARGTVRCPLRPQSMTLPHQRPTILQPPSSPPTCCTQKTITVPPSVNAKTTQKHDYPSAAHRRSYNRRTASERTNASIKDPATGDISRGFCRLTGLAPTALLTASIIIARNLRINDAFAAREAENRRRAACVLPPKQRKRRRQTTQDLTATTPP
jgi:hypothetical protein